MRGGTSRGPFFGAVDLPADTNGDTELKARIERLRIACGHAMGLGDMTGKSYPKMTLIAAPRHGGSLCTRSFSPHVCHDAIGVLTARLLMRGEVMVPTVWKGARS